MLTFAYPEIFWFLLLIPLIIGLYGLAKYIRSRSLKRFGNPDVFASLMPSVSKYMPPIKLTLQLLIVLFLIIVMARPWGGVKDQKSEKHGIEVVIAMDVSNSMLASSTGEDGGTSRLRTAKLMLEKLINKLDNDRVGLIVYAGEAYTLLPVTSDYVSAKMFLNTITTESVPIQGTAIGDAVNTALRSFSAQSEKSRAVIVPALRIPHMCAVRAVPRGAPVCAHVVICADAVRFLQDGVVVTYFARDQPETGVCERHI